MSDKTNECWVGFDLGGTKMLAVVYDADFKQLGKARKKTKGHEGKDAGLKRINGTIKEALDCLLYTSPSPRDLSTSRMPSSA